MLDNPSDLTIVGEKGSLGQLKVNLIPTDEVNSLYQTGTLYMGDVLEEKGEIIEEPEQLLNKPFYFKIVISGVNLQENNWKKVYVEYQFKDNGGNK